MVRFAVIGSNFIADRFLEAAKQCDEFTLTGYYSRVKTRAQEYAEKNGAPLAFDNLEELAQCKEIDAVYIASPTSLHYDHAMQMLNAKKHVLCEKPIASNSSELAAMLAAAKENNVVLLEAMRPLFSPGFSVIRDNLHKLGMLRRATLNYCQYSSRYDKFKMGIVQNAFNPALSNGALMDIGVYCVHMLVALFGMPQKISAASVGLKDSIDGEGTIISQYDDMLAELIYSKITNSGNSSEIQGENGCMHIKMLSIPQDVKIIYNSGEEEMLPIESQPHDMVYELREFIRLTAAPQQAERYNHCSQMAMHLMDEARRQTNIVFPADSKSSKL